MHQQNNNTSNNHKTDSSFVRSQSRTIFSAAQRMVSSPLEMKRRIERMERKLSRDVRSPFQDRTNTTGFRNNNNELSSTKLSSTSSLKQRLEVFEAVSQQAKEQNAILVKKKEKKACRLLFFWDDDDDDHPENSEKDLLQQHKLRNQQRQRLFGTLFHSWHVVFTLIAVLEMLSCLREAIDSLGSTSTTFNPASNYWTKLLLSIPFTEIQPYVNKIFMGALMVQLLVESWKWGESRVRGQETSFQEKKGEKRVTSRSKRRQVGLETTSHNRHFLQRWTGNVIRWDRVWTTVLLWALALLLLRALFVPIFHENPFQDYLEPATKSNIAIPRTTAISVVEAIAFAFHSAAAKKVEKEIRSIIGKIIRKILLTTPWQMSRRVQRIFRTIRWFKFMAPLVGTCNKLRGNCNDYRRKRTQRNRSRRANHLWSILAAASITADQKAIRAARALQRTYRKRKMKRAFNATISLHWTEQNETSLIRFQRLVRQSMSKQLSNKSKILRGTVLAHSKLRRKLEKQRQASKSTMLLRPNTTFSVTWKCVTITCVLLEITQILAAPMLNRREWKKIPIDELLHEVLGNYLESANMKVLVAIFVAKVVSAVSFLDVFITFFTGELSSDGKLIPKMWFTRWILPGVCLQLLVNPTMKDIACCVGEIIKIAKIVGPMRLLHVSVAILPVVKHCTLVLIHQTRDFVGHQNRVAKY